MVNRSGDKGTQAETWAAEYFSSQGFPGTERRTKNGIKDRGDLNTGQPKLVVEVKADKKMAYPEFLRETEAERVNAAAAVGVCVIKPEGFGKSRMGLWMMLMEGGTYDALEQVAGSANFMASWMEQSESVTPPRPGGRRSKFKPAALLAEKSYRLTMMPGTTLRPGVRRVGRTGHDMRFLYLEHGLELLRAAGLARGDVVTGV